MVKSKALNLIMMEEGNSIEAMKIYYARIEENLDNFFEQVRRYEHACKLKGKKPVELKKYKDLLDKAKSRSA